MLENLNFEITFPTGKTFSGDHNFTTGMTVITGRNERGKSLRVELVRFALFGSDALRGKAEDYRRMKIMLSFKVRGTSYVVKRSASRASLERAGDTIATGTRPVNEKIVEIFGYGLDVFDVANACTQGQIEALGNMKPTQRRAMIDQTIGLSRLDEAAEWCAEQRREHTLQADAIEGSIAEVVEPVRPSVYVASETLVDAVKIATEEVAELNRLRGWLASEPADPGARPSAPTDIPLDTLREQQSKRTVLITERTALQKERERMTPPSPMTAEQIEQMLRQHDAAEAFVKAENAYRALPGEPTYTREQLDTAEQEIQLAAKQRRRSALLDEGHICCPNCDHKWPVAAEAIAELGDIPQEPVKPTLTAPQLAAQRRALDAYEAAAKDRARLETELATPAEVPSIPKASLLKHQSSLVGKERWDEITARLPDLDREIAEIPDNAKLIIACEGFQRTLANWEAQSSARVKWLVDADTNLPRMKHLADAEQRLERFQTKLHESKAYELMLANYEKAKAHAEERRHAVEVERSRAKEFEKAKDALRDLKTKIKQHLIPSLSAVASTLIAQMTGGEHSMILIDDDFEVSVDGQPLDTLAGSAKAVANLSMRLGLGQVLTNRVFSVFMGDELDAAMDQERAGFTANCLRNLTKSISQVVVVSHKKLDADNYIEV